ncbi:MAG: ABC transporter ATP-binding protein [Candidatus Saccharibacteria bacterium]
MAREKTIIQIDNLTKLYGSARGVEDVSLSIKKGEVFGFLGPNGAGKSTTINCMLGTLQPTTGKIIINGGDVATQRVEIVKSIGYLSGDMETEPSLTGDQYIDYVTHLRGMTDFSRLTELKKLLRTDFSKKIKQMSRGDKQKVGLVVALMHDPDVLILDEPTSGLDPLMQATFNKIIKDHSKRGKTAFISSHILSEVEEICDRVGFIRDGKLVVVDTIENLRRRANKIITVRISGTKKLNAQLVKLKGVSGIELSGDNRLEFSFAGDVNELTAMLAKHQLEKLTISDSDLEKMFIGYYQEPGDV